MHTAKSNSPGESIPWKRIFLALAAATAVAWGVGFAAGLVVRFAFTLQ